VLFNNVREVLSVGLWRIQIGMQRGIDPSHRLLCFGGAFLTAQSLSENPMPHLNAGPGFTLCRGAHATCNALTRVCQSAVLSGVLLTTAAAAQVPAQDSFDTRGLTVLRSVEATGVQVYECRPDEAGRLLWVFREPMAILTADAKTVGRHFAGPSWQLNDGSGVVGRLVAQKPGATAQDIALLQLDVSTREGDGMMSRVTTVERLDTHGGAYSGACPKVGATHLEPYTARYVFLGG
jgi:hypothetical protein